MVRQPSSRLLPHGKRATAAVLTDAHRCRQPPTDHQRRTSTTDNGSSVVSDARIEEATRPPSFACTVGDTLAVQAAGDEGIVLRLYVTVWHGQDDAESAKQDAVKRYRLSVAEGDQVEALEAIQTVEHDGSISL